MTRMGNQRIESGPVCVFTYTLEQREKDKGGERKSEIVRRGTGRVTGQEDRGEKERERQEDGARESCSNKTDGVCSYRRVHVH